MFSLGSSASGLTAVAFERLEKLEASLQEEKARRAKAEEQLNQLKTMVDQRLGPATGSVGSVTARSGMSRTSSRGQLSARSQRVLSLKR